MEPACNPSPRAEIQISLLQSNDGTVVNSAWWAEPKGKLAMASRPELDRDQTLDALMRQWPGAVSVFIQNGIHCVGCSLSPFHCLKDAAQLHGVSEDWLAREIMDTFEMKDP